MAGHLAADTWCPAMEPMSQIMFYNHLATFGTIYKSAKGPQVGRFHNVMGPDVERWDSGVRPWNQCLKSCFIIIWQLLAPFTSQPRVHKWAGSTTGWVLMWNGDSGGGHMGVRPWNQCLKSCFIIIWQLWHHLQVSQGSTSGPGSTT